MFAEMIFLRRDSDKEVAVPLCSSRASSSYAPPRYRSGFVVRLARSMSSTGRLKNTLVKASEGADDHRLIEKLERRARKLGGHAKSVAARSLVGECLLYCAYRLLRASEMAAGRRILDDELISTAPDEQVELLRQTSNLLEGDRTHGLEFSPGLAAVGDAIAWLSSQPQESSDAIGKALGLARDDPWCHEISALSEVIDGLDMVATAVDRPEVAQAGESSWPPWLQWMLIRLRLLSPNASQYAVDAAAACPEAPAFPWMLDQWYVLYGWPVSDFDELRMMRSSWQRTAAECDERIRYMNRLRQEAAGLKLEDDSDSSPPQFLRWGVGERVSDLIVQELTLEDDFGKARLQLRQRNLQHASSLFETLLKDLQSRPRLSRFWWEPAVRYWLGVTYARRGLLEEARNELERTVDTAKGSDARAQLALLALSQGDLKNAERWIRDACAVTPGVHYASALLLSRRGEMERAETFLQAFEKRFTEPAVPYALASRRLRAVLQERIGNRAQAAQAYGAILDATPGDGVTMARALRCRVTEIFETLDRDDNLSTVPLTSLPDESELDLPLPVWFKDYQRLERTLMCSPEGVSDGRDDVIKAAVDGGLESPWLALLLWRLARLNKSELVPTLLQRALETSDGSTRLSADDGDGLEPARLDQLAEQLTKAESGTAPSTSLLAARVYLLWKELREAWRVLSDDSEKDVSERPIALRDYAKVQAEELRRVSVESPSANPSIWVDLADAFASALEDEPEAQSSSDKARADGSMYDRLFRSGAEPLTTDAIAVLLHSFGDDASLPAAPALLRDALTRLGNQDWEGFTKAYAGLTSDFCTLPVPAADLWLAWAQSRLLADDVDAVLTCELPDCLTDLSHVGVRSLIGVAYAKTAIASYAREDYRSALAQARQALSTLAPYEGGT